MRVLHVLSEYFPLVKTGGLADVGAALPQALRQRRVDARVLLPGYPEVLSSLQAAEVVWRDAQLFGGGEARLLKGRLGPDGMPAYVLDAPAFYARGGNPYVDAAGANHPDNHRRFAALSWVGALLCTGIDRSFAPDVAHAHDWQAGLLPAYLALRFARAVPSVQTIHNVNFPGDFSPEFLAELNLPAEAFAMHGIEFHGRLSFLKAGLFYADRLTTVSPTYAAELTTPQYGAGFDGLLASRSDTLTGILNGVDYAAWSPAHDAALAEPYDSRRLKGKQACRRALCDRFEIGSDTDVPVFGVVSRLTWQKGIDLLAEAARPLLARGAMRLAVLGSGDSDVEAQVQALADTFPGSVGFVRGYDEALSHVVQGGADCLAVPSRTEPCGLTQLYALRYGTVPIVRRTGGLADTVTDTTDETLASREGTGFVFDAISADALRDALLRAISLYADTKRWRILQRSGMRCDYGWSRSAGAYQALYRSLVARS